MRVVGRGLCRLCEFVGMSTAGSPLVNFSALENLKYQINVCSCHFDSAAITGSHEQEIYRQKDKQWVAAFRSEQGSIAQLGADDLHSCMIATYLRQKLW